MPFFPQVHDELTIDGTTYRFTEFPSLPRIPYGQEGRVATVYQLRASDREAQALKVFKPRFRLPALVALAERTATFSKLPGLQVCQRTVLTPQRHGALLRQYRDLIYAVLMPWIEGPTWMDVLGGRSPLTMHQSRALVGSLVSTLVTMEQKDLAHCDLSGPNILLPELNGGKGIALVDVEGMYAPTLDPPRDILSASPGYAHQSAVSGVWSTEADRFSGAVLLAEILGWCDPRVREAAAGDPAYFVAEELQQPSERYRVLTGALQERWGEEVVRLFARAWRSETLWDCPTFGEWLLALPKSEPSDSEYLYVGDVDRRAKVLLQQARSLEQEGKLEGALEAYEQVIALISPGNPLMIELEWTIEDLRSQIHSNTDSVSATQKTLKQFADEGIRAYDQGHWSEALELLEEVVRQSPGLMHGDREVAALLATAKKRVAAQQRRLPHGALLGGPAAVVLLVVVLFMLLWNRDGKGETVTTPVSLSPTAFVSATAERSEGGPLAEITLTATLTPTPSPTHTPSATLTPSATATDTSTPTATSTPTHTLTPTGPVLWDRRIRTLDTMEMVYVPAGSFDMGSTEAQVNEMWQQCNAMHGNCERSLFEREQPTHRVTLAGYWLDRWEVTNAQYRRCVVAGKCSPPVNCHWGEPTYGAVGKDEHPVVCVDWSDAASYCEWVGARLPTEAEWEYAARSPEGLIYPWGNTWREEYANCNESECKDGYEYTAPVGRFPQGASWVGVLDMIGNVWEWVSDWYGEYPSKAQINPTGPSWGEYRVLRGGSWYLDGKLVRSAYRNRESPSVTVSGNGFRCASPQSP